MPDINPNPTWSISDFYNKAWKLTKTHKKLWIFGLAVCVFAGAGNNFNSSGGNDSSSDWEDEYRQVEEVGAQEITTFEEFDTDSESEYSFSTTENMSAGESSEAEQMAAFENQASSYKQEIGSTLFGYLSQVSPTIYLLLGLEVLILIIYSVIFSLIASAWAQGALIKGIGDADEKNLVELTSVASFARTKIKDIIWISVLSGLKVLALLLIAGIATALTFTLSSVIGSLVLIPFFIFATYTVINYLAGVLVGERLIVLDNMKASEAYSQGIKASKGKKRKMIFLGFLNFIITMLLTFLILLPFIFLIGTFTQVDFSNTTIVGILIALAAIGITIFIPLMYVGQAIYKVFIFSVWHYAVQVIKSDFQEQSL